MESLSPQQTLFSLTQLLLYYNMQTHTEWPSSQNLPMSSIIQFLQEVAS